MEHLNLDKNILLNNLRSDEVKVIILKHYWLICSFFEKRRDLEAVESEGNRGTLGGEKGREKRHGPGN
jgi:hypothetical protein